MKIVFDKLTLQKAISPMLCAVSANTSLPATEGIQFKTEEDGTCTLTAYDLIKGVRTNIPAEIYSGGNIIINAAKLSQIVKVMPGNITFEVDENYKAKISSGKSEFSISVLPGENFSSLPDLRGEKGFETDKKVFKKMISQTIYAAAINDMRTALNGICISVKDNEISMVACDSFRIAIKKEISDIENRSIEKSDLDFSFIVPTKTMSELIRLISDDGKMKIMFTSKHVFFFLDDIIFFSRLIDSEYINYSRILPKENKTEVIIDREEFLGSLERASLITEDRSIGQEKSCVKISVKENSVIVSSTSVSGSSFDEIHTVNKGDMLVIGFNCKFLIDSIRATDSEKLKLKLSSPLSSMIIEPEWGEDEEHTGEYIFAVTPLRMKDSV